MYFNLPSIAFHYLWKKQRKTKYMLKSKTLEEQLEKDWDSKHLDYTLLRTPYLNLPYHHLHEWE